MRGVVVTTEGLLYVKDFGAPLYKSLGEAVGGYIEVVHPLGFQQADPVHRELCFVCNEEGSLKHLDLNAFASVLYGTHVHGSPIVGNIVIMREGMTNGDRDFVEMEDADIEWVKDLARWVSGGLIREVQEGDTSA